MTQEEQLDLWLVGNPTHNPKFDMCCPDFSCCGGELAPIETRKDFCKAFYANDHPAMEKILAGFLSKAFDRDIHVIVEG